MKDPLEPIYEDLRKLMAKLEDVQGIPSGVDPDAFQDGVSRAVKKDVKRRVRRLPLFQDPGQAQRAGDDETMYDLHNAADAIDEYLSPEK